MTATDSRHCLPGTAVIKSHFVLPDGTGTSEDLDSHAGTMPVNLAHPRLRHSRLHGTRQAFFYPVPRVMDESLGRRDLCPRLGQVMLNNPKTPNRFIKLHSFPCISTTVLHRPVGTTYHLGTFCYGSPVKEFTYWGLA